MNTAHYRPSEDQLQAARTLLAGDPHIDSVIVPLVTPGKDNTDGAWRPGQQLVTPLATFPVLVDHGDPGWLAARAFANAVSRDVLARDFSLVGGTCGHAWVWRHSDGAPLFSELYLFTGGEDDVAFAVFEDVVVQPTH